MDFEKLYCDLKIRVAPYRKSGAFEFVKTVAAIDALADRADVIHSGAKVCSRFGWSQGYEVDALINRAFMYLDALEQGNLPLKGKYSEPGIALVDHTFVELDGVMHVFYNRGYIGYTWPERFVDSFGHATSTDLLNWTPLPPVFTAEKGGHDDYQVWSPGIIKHNGEYWMFYTGVNYNIAQAGCLAKSKDLINWERYQGNPVFIPGNWCPWSKDKWSDCRDGMVFEDDNGMFYMYYCTTKIMEDGSYHNALGTAVSSDLYIWKDEGAFIIKTSHHAPESPFVVKRNGTYYMFITNCGNSGSHGTAYLISDNPLTGWHEPENQDSLIIPGASCSEVLEFKGKWYISLAQALSGGEEYLEFREFFWNDDGTVMVGDYLR